MASGDYVVVWDADLTYATEMIGALLAAAQERSADIVLASAYMRGGQSTRVPFLRRWLSRSANWLLSLAVHGEFATLTCMVRVYRRQLLSDLLRMYPQAGTTFELLLAARAQGAIIHEIPAHLDWSRQDASRRKRVSPARMLKSTSDVVRCAVRFRPALILAVPGLFPGLLPLALATAAILHQSMHTISYVATITIVVQYCSLFAFTWQLRTFATRLLGKRRLMSLE
jgi:glycosyltransferase involved in cell wall biosynthesis